MVERRGMKRPLYVTLYWFCLGIIAMLFKEYVNVAKLAQPIAIASLVLALGCLGFGFYWTYLVTKKPTQKQS
jgi:hypothetical protein